MDFFTGYVTNMQCSNLVHNLSVMWYRRNGLHQLLDITSIINIVALRYELDLAQKRKFPLGSAEHFQTFFGGRRVCQGGPSFCASDEHHQYVCLCERKTVNENQIWKWRGRGKEVKLMPGYTPLNGKNDPWWTPPPKKNFFENFFESCLESSETWKKLGFFFSFSL